MNMTQEDLCRAKQLAFVLDLAAVPGFKPATYILDHAHTNTWQHRTSNEPVDGFIILTMQSGDCGACRLRLELIARRGDSFGRWLFGNEYGDLDQMTDAGPWPLAFINGDLTAFGTNAPPATLEVYATPNEAPCCKNDCTI